MRRIATSLLLALLSLATRSALAQASAETPAIWQTITTFSRACGAATARWCAARWPPGQYSTPSGAGPGSRPGQPARLAIESINDFLKAVATPHADRWDERVQFERIVVDANLASVWAPYEFYLGNKFSHCGYDSFQLVKLADGWRIAHIIDTRRKEQCK